MLKLFIRAEIIASATFTFTTTIYQQKKPDGYFKRELLNNSRLEEGSTYESSYIIWDLKE